jgi:hypothetical protein
LYVRKSIDIINLITTITNSLKLSEWQFKWSGKDVVQCGLTMTKIMTSKILSLRAFTARGPTLD